MLYKNLPQQDLRTVMFVRSLLDYVAAFQYLVKLDWGNFVAVFKARWAFAKMKPEYETVRKENLSLAVQDRFPGWTSHFLIWNYYARGKRVFSSFE